MARPKGVRHGMNGSPEHTVWNSMKKRCSPNTGHVGNRRLYVDRGITVCEEWMNDFMQFYRDMGPRPGEGYVLARIDRDGDYEPGNCRWILESVNTQRVTIYDYGEFPCGHPRTEENSRYQNKERKARARCKTCEKVYQTRSNKKRWAAYKAGERAKP